MTNIFEQVTRHKVRFHSTKGSLTVEDLWDLPLTALDTLAISLNHKIKESAEESFLDPKPTKANELLTLRFAVVKHIIEVRLAEQKAKTEALANKQHNEQIDQLIAKKKEEKLTELSLEELEKMRK